MANYKQHIYKYVDKERILPWLVAEIIRLKLLSEVDKSMTFAIVELEHIKGYIEDGLWDWQPSQ